MQSAALQVLGNVACGDDRQTQVVIDSDALPCLRALLSSADRGIRKEVCWIVSNITESSHQVQDVLDADILPPLLKLLDNQDAACREDATWVLFNLSSNRDPNQIAYLAEKNGVRALCNLLTCSKELDVLWKGCGTVAAVALKGLRNILISGQIAAASDPSGYNRMASLVAEAHGVERIEALTTHISMDVRTRARLLLERMFGAEPTTADPSPPLPPPAVSGLSSLSSPPPPPPLGHGGCACAYQQHHQQHHGHGGHHYQATTLYDVTGNVTSHNNLAQPSHLGDSLGVDHALPGHIHSDGDLLDVPGSTSGSSTDSDPEDDDSDSDLIPPPPAPCSCVLCTDPSPLAERRQRGKGSFDDTDFQKKNGADISRGAGEVRPICSFCSGGGRLGDGRAGLAAKLGRGVRLGHPHCIAVLLSRMTWTQRVAATEAPALLHPGGGPPDGGVGSSLPAVVLAAQLGKPECLALLLRRCKPDLDVTHGKKRLTALAWSAHKGYMRCCQLLIEHGANPATRCGDGVTALHLAASGGGHAATGAICKLLIDHGAPVNARSAKKQTPLCLAAQKGSAKVVHLLVQHGADVNNEDEGKYTPLHLSASNGFVSSVDLLLKAGARVDSRTRNEVTPLHYAVQGGHAHVVRLLIAASAKVNCNKKPLLLIAADDGNLEVVQILLDANAEIDCKANIKAMLDKEIEVLDYLTPLHLAASKNHTDVVELLLRRGSNVNEVTTKSGWSALDFAVLNGHADCAVSLLEHGAIVTDNCKSIGRNNWTLVQYAASNGAKDVVRLLIQRLKEQRTNSPLQRENASYASAKYPTTEPPAIQIAAVEGQKMNGNAIGHYERNPNIDYIAANGTAREDLRCTCHESCLHHHGEIENEVRSAHRYDPRSLEGDERGFGTGAGYSNGASASENEVKPAVSRRRHVKEDRQNSLRAREIMKRESEATEARYRLEEAISQRSASKLTEAIAHVNKLVLHLNNGTGGGHGDHSDGNTYESHDSYAHGSHVHSPGGKHPTPSSASTPLAMEVGLGNEVHKARKILAGLVAEEKKAREEREREVADSKRENVQQSVRKAINGALDGGDPRSLSRAINRATRSILENDDAVVMEARRVGDMISRLEKSAIALRTASNDQNLAELENALFETQSAVSKLQEQNGDGAASRVFGSDPKDPLKVASTLLDKLREKKQNEIAREAAAKNLERAAHEELIEAMQSSSIVDLERALEKANNALITRESELVSSIEAAKKVMTRRVKSERRRLRQANATNDPQAIEEAAALAEGYGIQALKPDVESAKALAQKLREQAEALEQLEDAVASSDVQVLGRIRSKLNAVGMFAEAERARAEIDRIQREARARTLLDGTLQEARDLRDPVLNAFASSKTPEEILELISSWTWPDVQKLLDLSDRGRNYGESMQSLCDSADEVTKELAALGRQILSLSESCGDARLIASMIAGYEKSFLSVSKANVFDKNAGEKCVEVAKQRLAKVQAMDQASVKAESAQVKVEYALATSRRSAARSRNVKNGNAGKSNGQTGIASMISSHANSDNGFGGDGDMESPSSISTEFVDEEVTEAVPNAMGVLSGENVSSFKASEFHRASGAKKTRSIQLHGENGMPSDAMGDLPSASPGECSHFYLFKEGTTVFCARCGNLRSSSNPEWLARVKRRGNKVPPEIYSGIPTVGSSSDLHASLTVAGLHLGTHSRSPSSLNSQNVSVDRSQQRLGRSPGATSATQHMSQGFPSGSIPPVREPVRGSSTVGQRGGSHAHSMNIMAQVLHSQHHTHVPKPSGNHRGRGRHHASSHAASGNRPFSSMSNLYTSDSSSGRTPMQSAPGVPSSISMSSNYSTASGLQGLGQRLGAQHSPSHGYGLGSRALQSMEQKRVLRVSGDMVIVGDAAQQHGLRVDNGGDNHRMASGLGVTNRHNVGRSSTSEEFGGPGMDLGVDFANENFGFDIDAIVDDNPLPQQSKTSTSQGLGSQRDGTELFVPNPQAQQNGFFQR